MSVKRLQYQTKSVLVMYGVLFTNSSTFGNHFNIFPLACEKIQLSTFLQLHHLAVAIVPPVIRVPQFEKAILAH